ncbi:heterokaryon incompatibility protein-domain-containing protein [Bisporella sp. PMI_857]|nr:heterokaryon incompatibility protein-domain-containing protein [Bisporella sp. PMI_857]
MGIHRPLNPENLEFRILRLHSLNSSIHTVGSSPLSADKVPIFCELKHAYRGEKPYYEALSYTWGDARQTAPIVVDGHEVQVTKNLHDALTHIREDSIDTFLWIDALCINQSDNAEKGDQVGQMRDIYSDAAKTILWLGPADDTSDEIIKQLETIGKSINENGIRDMMIQFARLPPSASEEYSRLDKNINDSLADYFDAAYLDLPGTLEFLKGCKAISERPYWRRVWILQEYIVSKSVSILCGNQTIPYDHFHAMLLYLALMTVNIAQKLHTHIVSIIATQDVTELYNLFMGITSNGLDGQPTRISGMRLRYHSRGSGNVFMSLIKLLANVHVGNASHATDDRDRVFALLGMASDFEMLRIIPNYSKDSRCVDVYTTAARRMIENGDVDVLSFSQYHEEQNEFPSWVPDWRKDLLRPCGQLPWDTSFKASGSAPHESPPQVDLLGKDEIRLSGYLLDTIERVAPNPWCPTSAPLNFKYPDLPIYLDNILELCKLSDDKLVSSSQISDPYPNPEDRKTASIRVPVADMEQYGIGFVRHAAESPSEGRYFDNVKSGYDGVREEISSGKSGGATGGAQTLDVVGTYNMLSFQTYRRPILLANGLVGLGPARSEAGDVIAIFKGAKFPYVLRRHSVEGRWRFMGEAYVHGIMYGELFGERSHCHRLNLEDFVLK